MSEGCEGSELTPSAFYVDIQLIHPRPYYSLQTLVLRNPYWLLPEMYLNLQNLGPRTGLARMEIWWAQHQARPESSAHEAR